MRDAAQTPQESEPQTASGDGGERSLKRPRSIRFAPEWTPLEAAEHIFAVRFAEVLALSAALAGEVDERHHAFRLACKRLRYAIERNDPQLLGLEGTAQWLSEMTDALGEAHDAVVLRDEALEAGASHSAASLRKHRQEALQTARSIWKTAFAPGGRAEPLAHLINTAPATVKNEGTP